MALGTGVYGTNASNAVTYGIPQVAAGGNIGSTLWNTMSASVNNERTRRGHGTIALAITNPITASIYTAMKTALEVAGPAASQAYMPSGTQTILTYPQVGAPTGTGSASAGSNITATAVNLLINEINSAGSVCTCNCNYCTCNCNYCTCNCNYACTCNCNYSDKRLKTDIKLVECVDGVNVYTFSYISDILTTYVGAMAQELLGTKYAHAVGLDASGYHTVDYSKLPISFKIVK